MDLPTTSGTLKMIYALIKKANQLDDKYYKNEELFLQRIYNIAFLNCFKFYLENNKVSITSREYKAVTLIVKVLDNYTKSPLPTKKNTNVISYFFSTVNELDTSDFYLKIIADESNIREIIAKKIILFFKINQKIEIEKLNISTDYLIIVLERVMTYFRLSFQNIIESQNIAKQLLANHNAIYALLLSTCRALEKQEKILSDINASIQKVGNSCFITTDFWTKAQESTDIQSVKNFYIRLDSRKDRLPGIIKNGEHVTNSIMIELFKKKLDEILLSKEKEGLIVVTSAENGGEGKSTFMWDLAYRLYEKYNVLFLTSANSNETEIHSLCAIIKENIEGLSTSKKILVLIDNIYNIENISTKYRKIYSQFIPRTVIVVAFERKFRYENIQDIEEFEACFTEPIMIEYTNHILIRKAIFKKAFSQINKNITYSGREISRLENSFSSSNSMAVNICNLLCELNSEGTFVYKFDWKDWEDFVSKTPEIHDRTKWKKLYTFVALFYQFGIAPSITLCSKVLSLNFENINLYPLKQKASPIYINENHLYLTHEQKATWYFNDNINRFAKKSREAAISLFKRWEEILDQDTYHFFSNITQHPEFEKSFLNYG